MIRVYILRVSSLMKEDFFDLVDALPFGEDEKRRLLATSSSRHRWESLGGLVALDRLLHKCDGDFSEHSTVITRASSGKPYFDSPTAPYFGISHSDGIAAAAIVDYKYGEIGFDIEVIDRKHDFSRIAKRYFTEEEKRQFASNKESAESFYSIWTAKEAYAKIDGRGLSALMADKAAQLMKSISLSRLSVDVGERRAVMSVCSYVAGQPVQIYTDSEVTK